MPPMKFILGLSALCWAMPAWATDLTFNGACDASAAVLVGPDRLAVGDDEGDDIRVYAPTGGDPIEPPKSLEAQLDQADPKNEADLEGVAELGGRLFWIGSHARNGDGEPQPDRQRILITTGDLAADGKPGRQLLPAIAAADKQWKLGLTAAIGDQGATVPGLAAEKAGLNIEGIAILPPGGNQDGRAVGLIGLRNPLTADGHAIVLQVRNIEAAASGKEAPDLGDPVLLDLAGRGIRDLAWSAGTGSLLILAGPMESGEAFTLYRQKGWPAGPPQKLADIQDLHAEVVVAAEASRVLLLSDDGDTLRPVASKDECKKKDFSTGQCLCKGLKGAAAERKSFRGRWVEIDPE
jgi:hypothetical protein